MAALLVWLILRELGFLSTLQAHVALAAATAIIGLVATHLHLKLTENKSTHADPQYVVIDEWAGLYITLIALPPAPAYLPLLGFALFRLLDIRKPGPIRAAEKLPGAVGIMADDIVAGLIGLAIIQSLLAWLL